MAYISLAAHRTPSTRRRPFFSAGFLTYSPRVNARRRFQRSGEIYRVLQSRHASGDSRGFRVRPSARSVHKSERIVRHTYRPHEETAMPSSEFVLIPLDRLRPSSAIRIQPRAAPRDLLERIRAHGVPAPVVVCGGGGLSIAGCAWLANGACLPRDQLDLCSVRGSRGRF